MSMSKTYPVKSNAARAAKPYGLTRANLQQVDGGWAFEIPAGAVKQQVTSDRPVKQPKAKAGRTKAKRPAKAKRAASTKAKRKAGPKSGKIAEVISELKQRWTPADDILKKTGWVSNTFRGILGAHKRNTGEKFERKVIDGATHYRIAA